MLESGDIPDIASHALKIMQLFESKQRQKGSLTTDAKFKSLAARWYACKKASTTSLDCPISGEASGNSDTVERDILVKMKCKRGKHESLERYRVLAIFSKH